MPLSEKAKEMRGESQVICEKETHLEKRKGDDQRYKEELEGEWYKRKIRGTKEETFQS